MLRPKLDARIRYGIPVHANEKDYGFERIVPGNGVGKVLIALHPFLVYQCVIDVDLAVHDSSACARRGFWCVKNDRLFVGYQRVSRSWIL
jgi:hypothetical protein